MEDMKTIQNGGGAPGAADETPGALRANKNEGGLPGVLRDITERVRYYARRSAGDMLELGKALTEAKELVPHGEWSDYLRENAGMEQRTAQNFMQAYRRWGTENREIAELNVGQIIALLPATEEEIEKISAETSLADMSSREIKKAIQAAREEEQQKARETEKKAREEERSKAREALDALRESNLNELVRQKEAAERELREAISAAEQEKREAVESVKAESEEQIRQAIEGARQAGEAGIQRRDEQIEALKAAVAEKERAIREETEARAQAEEVARAALEGSRSSQGSTAEAERRAAALRREIAEKDEAIRELQEGYDQMQADLLDAKSRIAKGDADRSDGEILSAERFQGAVNSFLSEAGRIPYMHGRFAAMDTAELERWEAGIRMIAEWAEKALDAAGAIRAEGGIR